MQRSAKFLLGFLTFWILFLIGLHLAKAQVYTPNYQLNGTRQVGAQALNFSGFTGSSLSGSTLTILNSGLAPGVTLTTLLPLRCDGGGSCTLGANRTLSFQVPGQTTNDILYYNAGWTRLPGPLTNGEVLTLDSGILGWGRFLAGQHTFGDQTFFQDHITITGNEYFSENSGSDRIIEPEQTSTSSDPGTDLVVRAGQGGDGAGLSPGGAGGQLALRGGDSGTPADDGVFNSGDVYIDSGNSGDISTNGNVDIGNVYANTITLGRPTIGQLITDTSSLRLRWNAGTPLLIASSLGLSLTSAATVDGQFAIQTDSTGIHALRFRIRNDNTAGTLYPFGVTTLYLGLNPDEVTLANTNTTVGRFGTSSLDSGISLFQGGLANYLVGSWGGGDIGCAVCGPASDRRNFIGLYGSKPSTTWAGATGYSFGSNVVNSGNLYEETTAGSCTSGGVGPTGTGSSIADGTCTWAWVRVQAAAIPGGSPWVSLAKDVDTRFFWGAGRWSGGWTMDAPGDTTSPLTPGLHTFACAASGGTNPGCTVSWAAGAASGLNQNGGIFNINAGARTGSGNVGVLNLGTDPTSTGSVNIGNASSTTTINGSLSATGSTQTQALNVQGLLTFTGSGQLGSSLNPNTANSRSIGSSSLPLLDLHVGSTTGGLYAHGDLTNTIFSRIYYNGSYNRIQSAGAYLELDSSSHIILQPGAGAFSVITASSGGLAYFQRNNGDRYVLLDDTNSRLTLGNTASGNQTLLQGRITINSPVDYPTAGSIAAATTIAPTAFITHITGHAADIETITPPTNFASGTRTGQLVFIFDDSLTQWLDTGNIAVSSNTMKPRAGTTVVFTWDNATSKWYPSNF